MSRSRTGIHVALATDGSASAMVAVDLVAGLHWSADSRVDVITVVPSSDYEDAGREVVDAAASSLATSGVAVTCQVLYGRPASRIVEHAADVAADLIVVGSRGHGTIASMLLGSVAAEVVDRAARPVLVARNRQVNHVLLGHDGSECSDEAARLLEEWPVFATPPIDVVAVAELTNPWHLVSTSTLYGTAVHDYFEDSRAVLEEHSALADRVAARLVRAGRQAVALMADGEPAAKLIEVARIRSADLIVVGTHGRTGFTRLVIGSVARNVLIHSRTSVLVACRAADQHTAPAVADD